MRIGAGLRLRSNRSKWQELIPARMIPTENANNFTCLRLVAAVLVIVSHGVELPTGLAQHDWVYSLTGHAVSWYAVNAFFVVSGYLILTSWERTPTLTSFSWARFLRIMPGLFVMLIVTSTTLGIAFSEMSLRNFATSSETLTYIIGCLSILFVK